MAEVKLTELKPTWLSPDVFCFLCPHCREERLLCKRIPLSFKGQVKLVNATPEDDEDWPQGFVPARAEFAWKFNQGDSFDSITVTPSIDASASGHWHGNITGGKIVGGV